MNEQQVIMTTATEVPENPPVADPNETQTTTTETTAETQTTTTETTTETQTTTTESTTTETTTDIPHVEAELVEDGETTTNDNGGIVMNYKEIRKQNFEAELKRYGLTKEVFLNLFEEGVASEGITYADLKAANKAADEKSSADKKSQKAYDKANKQPMSTKKKVLIGAGIAAGAAAVGAGIYFGTKAYNNHKAEELCDDIADDAAALLPSFDYASVDADLAESVF